MFTHTMSDFENATPWKIEQNVMKFGTQIENAYANKWCNLYIKKIYLHIENTH